MQNEEKGITLGQLCHVMFGINKQRKILLGIITGCLFIVLALGLKFVYNSSKEVYTADFNWKVVGLNEGKYVDGSRFDYLTLQTSEVLKEVKSSNNDFANIDVDSMVNNGKFSIQYVEEMDKNQEKVLKTYYRISTLQKYFKSSSQAREFISAVTCYPINKSISMLDKINYKSNLTSYDNSIIFDTQVNYLEAQYKFLTNTYDSLIATYGGNISLSSSNTLTQVKQDLTTYFTNYRLNDLKNDIANYGYVKSYGEYNEILISNLRSARLDYQDNLEEQNELIKQRDALLTKAGESGFNEQPSTASYDEKIANITSANKDLLASMRRILRKLARNVIIYPDQAALEAAFPQVKALFANGFDDIYDGLDASLSSTEFANKMDTKYRDKLVDYTDTLKNVQKEVITNYSSTSFTTAGIVEASGGLSTPIILIGSVVLSLLCGMIVNLCLDSSHLHDDEKKNVFVEENGVGK